MKRLFITGASGFIGARVVRLALDAGHPVAVLWQPGAPRDRLTDVADRVRGLTGDAGHPDAWISDLAAWRPDACLHFAWYAEPGRYLTAHENLDCMTGSLALFRALAAAGCRHVVAAGTCAEYEPGPGPLSEDDPVNPATLYAACKLATGLVGRHMAADGGFTLAWGRIFHLFGPGEDPRRLVPAAIRALLRGEAFNASTGGQQRDYLHVDDVANAFLTLAERGGSGTYNICSGEPVTIRRLLEILERLTGRRDLIRFGTMPGGAWDPPCLVGNCDRLRALGWKPRRTLEEGLEQTTAWWRRHKETA